MHNVAPASASGRPQSSATISTPGRSSAPSASSAKPTPPAAPAPGTSRKSRPSARAIASAVCASAASSFGRSCGFAPFCGPKTADAPVRTAERIVDVGGDQDRRVAQASDRDPRDRSRVMPCSAFGGSVAAPSARSRPMPASFVALPPIPITISRAPASSAARISSPVPRESARHGSRSSGAAARAARARHLDDRTRPLERERRCDRTARADRGRRASRACAPDSRTSSTVPSPPSAIGRQTISAYACDATQTARDRVGDVMRARGPFEFVRRDDDAPKYRATYRA